MCNWRLVQAGASVDVNRVDDIVGGFDRVVASVGHFVLASGREQQTSIRGECEPPEEGCQRLVIINVCILDADSAVNVGREIDGFNGRQW